MAFIRKCTWDHYLRKRGEKEARQAEGEVEWTCRPNEGLRGQHGRLWIWHKPSEVSLISNEGDSREQLCGSLFLGTREHILHSGRIIFQGSRSHTGKKCLYRSVNWILQLEILFLSYLSLYINIL